MLQNSELFFLLSAGLLLQMTYYKNPVYVEQSL